MKKWMVSLLCSVLVCGVLGSPSVASACHGRKAEDACTNDAVSSQTVKLDVSRQLWVCLKGLGVWLSYQVELW